MTLIFLCCYKTIAIKKVIYLEETKEYYIFKIKDKSKFYYLNKKDTKLLKKINYTKFNKIENID